MAVPKEIAVWILLDWDEFIIHVFYLSVLEFYELERLWADAPAIECVNDHDPKPY